MTDQKQREAALRRRYGSSPEATARLKAFNEAQTDWYAFCKVCGERLQGSLAQLREHKHDPAG